MCTSPLFFKAYDGTHGEELWKSDGTASGTVMVKDIDPAGSAKPDGLFDFEGTLYFAANNGSAGRELWKSDGTEAGTQMVSDIFINSGSSWPRSFTNVDGVLFFSANSGGNAHGVELWKLGEEEPANISSPILPESIRVFPNPTQDIVYMELGHLAEPVNIVITDLTGKELLSQKTGKGKIELGQLASGVYLMRVYDGERLLGCTKIIKN